MTEQENLLVEQVVTKRKPVVPLRGMLVYPATETHLDLGRKFSVQAVQTALREEEEVLLAFQKNIDGGLPTEETLYPIGVIAKIRRSISLPVDGMRVVVRAERRVKITQFDIQEEMITAEYEEMSFDTATDDGFLVQQRVLKAAFEDYVKRNNRLNAEGLAKIQETNDLEDRLNMISSFLNVSLAEKYELLAQDSAMEKAALLLELFIREAKFSDMEKVLNDRVKAQVEQNQKEYYLREKIKAISEELGEGENKLAEIEEFKEQLEKLELSEELHAKILKEINRLAKISTVSPEYTIARSYIDTMLSLPWQKYSEDRLDIKVAEKILEEQHYGLEKVKERILESLAVRQMRQDHQGTILCLVGPPGVGKTSLAKSIAEALNRKFVRLSLGGMQDEAEIRGHRRTYVGAMPGRIMRGLIDAGTANPVFLLDEIDKMSSNFRGDPAAALLEVLDPEQNRTFSDHYVEVPFDLSKVFFITTANSLQTISRPLQDRMEIIELSSYIEKEKMEIAKQYLLKKQLAEHGLQPKQVIVQEAALTNIIRYYTKEAGVRGLERQLASICRKATRELLTEEKKQVRVTPKNLEQYLGKPRYLDKIEELQDEVGKVNGMAWTAVGGESLAIEAIAFAGKGKLELTGQMGDVMQESAKLGFAYIRSISSQLGLAEDFYEKYDLHLHIPEGATPKDGPSAGISMATAMISALTGKKVRKDVAMTGELTLRGKVLPVGGIKEKVLAAYRAGCRVIILPQENRRDIEEIPAEIREELTVHPVEHLQQVLEIALLEG